MDLFAEIAEFSTWTPFGNPQKLTESKLYPEVDHITVESSDYGPRFCFFLKNGNFKSIFASRDANVEVGDSINPDSVVIQRFEREGKYCDKAFGVKL